MLCTQVFIINYAIMNKSSHELAKSPKRPQPFTKHVALLDSHGKRFADTKAVAPDC